MLSRSAGKPVFLALSTAAILAAGTVHVQAEDIKPALELTVTVDDKAPDAGETVTIPATVKAVDKAASGVQVSIKVTTHSSEGIEATPEGCVPGCGLESISANESKSSEAKVTVPKTIKKSTVVVLDISATGTDANGDKLESLPQQVEITYAPLKVTPSPSPTPTKPPKPSPTPTPTKTKAPDKEKDDGKDDNSGSGSGSSGSGSSGSTYTPPAPNGAFNTPNTVQSPQVALPPIAPPAPSVAPQMSPSPESRLRNNKAPVAQDLTFERMASTQIAWLAALLVAFSLLITQLKLGRRRPVPGTARAIARTGRPKGEHRRPRRGVFGK
ncbi:hypothetical protein [Actinomadura sp. 9N407]|uniref:hypothetical protein n=1 Tax=Actinomadura sp. 9N407 TaxID=3375154 RepID=UPI0037A47549